MKKIIDYLKDKIYYVLAITVVIIIILVILNACSNRSSANSYENIESKMVEAAKEYYASRESNLPSEDGDFTQVTIGTLIDAELLSEITDPEDNSQTCSGHVEVTKVGDDYSYTPFLTCKGNYEAKYLTDIIEEVKTDEYGNGVYTIDDELVYRGDDVDNYVSFNDQLWRIVKVDSEGDIKLILAVKTDDYYVFDDAYNSERGDNVGITTDYLHTNIRKSLNDYYEENFTTDSKAKIVSKDLCIGTYAADDAFSKEKECSKIEEDEKIGLPNATDFKNASLSEVCNTIEDNECGNYNYLSTDNISTWTLNTSSENTYRAIRLSRTLSWRNASVESRINPTIYVTNKSVVSTGDGTQENPYVIK